ncbi:hypothetical protein BH11ACT7_BH11ACT7_23670 [soil metagenome]
MFLAINGVALSEFDVDDAELFVNQVATDGELDISYVATKLRTYAEAAR